MADATNQHPVGGPSWVAFLGGQKAGAVISVQKLEAKFKASNRSEIIWALKELETMGVGRFVVDAGPSPLGSYSTRMV